MPYFTISRHAAHNLVFGKRKEQPHVSRFTMDRHAAQHHVFWKRKEQNSRTCRASLPAGMLRTTMFSGKVCGVPVQLIRPADWNACPLFRYVAVAWCTRCRVSRVSI
eukprot:scaffold193894_cov20-Tisochrysis_lutea.AAC.1